MQKRAKAARRFRRTFHRLVTGFTTLANLMVMANLVASLLRGSGLRLTLLRTVACSTILAFLLAGTNTSVAIQFRDAWASSKFTITMTSHWVETKQVSPTGWTHNSTALSLTVTISIGAYRAVEADFMSSGSWWHANGLTKVPKTLSLEVKCQT